MFQLYSGGGKQINNRFIATLRVQSLNIYPLLLEINKKHFYNYMENNDYTVYMPRLCSRVEFVIKYK